MHPFRNIIWPLDGDEVQTLGVCVDSNCIYLSSFSNKMHILTCKLANILFFLAYCNSGAVHLRKRSKKSVTKSNRTRWGWMRLGDRTGGPFALL